MLLVRLVRSDREMEARLGEIIFKVSIWVLVIVSPRSSLEKLSDEQAGIAKPEVESFIKLVFGNEIEFVADVTAGTGPGGNRNRSAAGVEIVVCGGQPEAFQGLLDFPFLSGVFFHADPELHEGPAAHPLRAAP